VPLLIPVNFIILQAVFVLVGAGSCLYGLAKLREEPCPPSKRRYILKHLVTILLLVLIWAVPLVNL
jgi:hypothetical protein